MFSFLRLTKRRKFVLVSVLLGLSLFAIHFYFPFSKFGALAVLVFLSYFLSAWALKEGLDGIEWLTVLLLPVLFTGALGTFFFLIPPFWWAQLGLTLFFGLGFYALLLTENIFSVAAVRTIQLLRSAQTVGFLITVLTAFLFYDILLSLRLIFWLNFVTVFVLTLLLVFQSLWSIELDKKISFKLLSYTFALSLIVGQTALIFSFWPLSVSTGSLALTTVLYVVLNLTQHRLGEKLFQKTIKENLFIAVIVFLTILFTASWVG